MRKDFETQINNTQILSAVKGYLNSDKSFFLNEKYLVMPGLCDVHVHFREPGFCYKETIKSGSMSASAGGFTTVFTMPNLNPTPDSVENIKIQLDAIEKSAVVNVLPYATITVGEKGELLSDMENLSKFAIAFSDDGRGVQNDDLMKQAMLKAKSLNKPIVAHCEVNSFICSDFCFK